MGIARAMVKMLMREGRRGEYTGRALSRDISYTVFRQKYQGQGEYENIFGCD